MSSPLKMDKARAGISYLLIACFMLLLWLPTLDSFFGLDKAPQPNEKRAPAKFPAFKSTSVGLQDSLHAVRDFFAGLEAYYNDHFGFRKRLIRWHHRWKRQLFKESSLSDVMIGNDGWLFYAGEHMIETYRGTRLFKPDELKEWQELLEARHNWLAQRGILYLFVIPSDKHTVYPEQLPDWLVRANSISKLDQFIEHMKANSKVEILDLRGPLIEAKKTMRTYQYTDTHWTWYGAFVGYQSVIKALSRHIPGLKPFPIDAFEQKTIVQPGGDLAGMLGQEQTMPEKDYIILEPRPPLKKLDPIMQTDRLVKKWNRGTEPAVTQNPDAKGKVVVFRDSFAGGWTPFLGQHFNEVIYIWQYEWDTAFIEREKPDVVIDEMLERFLNKQDPKKLQLK